MKALILAGGYATRLWPLTKDKAKPLLMINGKPMVTHIVDKIPKNVEIFVATNMKFKKSFEAWKKTMKRPIKMIYEETSEESKKLGALGGIVNAINEVDIKEDLLVVGGDNYFQFSIHEFLDNYEGLPLIAAYDLKNLEDAKKFGVLSVKGKRVVKFREKPEHPDSTLVNTMCMLIPSNVFPTLHEFVKIHQDNPGSFVEYLIKKGEVQAYITAKEWFDIGSFEGYLTAHKKVSKDREGEFDFYGADFVGKNVLEGKVFIDKGTLVKNSRLKDCIIFGDCHIVNCTLTNCIIDEGSRLENCTIKEEIVETKTERREKK